MHINTTMVNEKRCLNESIQICSTNCYIDLRSTQHWHDTRRSQFLEKVPFIEELLIEWFDEGKCMQMSHTERKSFQIEPSVNSAQTAYCYMQLL